MDSSLSRQTASNLPSQTPAFIFPTANEESKFDFWGVLNRRKWLVFLGLVTGLALGGLYHAQCEEIFESEAQIRIEPKNPVSFRLTTTDLISPNAKDLMDTRHDRFIGGDNIVRKCLLDNELMDLPSFNDIPERDVVKYVREHLECEPDREETTLYDLKFYCKNREDVSMVLNHLILTYKNEIDDRYKEEADKYKELLDRVQNDFTGSHEKLREELRVATEKYDAPIVLNGMNPHQVALSQLELSMQESRGKISEASSLKFQVLKAFDNGLEAINTLYANLVQKNELQDFSRLMNDGASSDIKLRINAIEIELQTQLQKFGPSHPDVKSLRQQVAYWRQYLDENKTSNSVLVADPEIALNRFLLSLNQQISDEQAILEQDTRNYIKHEVEAQRLAKVQREIELIESEIADVNELIKMATMKITEVDPSLELNSRARNEGYHFDITMHATPGSVVWPILPAILGIGGLLGLLGGFGLGCLVELADKTFHNPDEIMKQLQIPLIGHIPVIGQSKRYLVENSLIEPIVCTYHRPKSQVSESFRAVRTSLYFNTQGKQHSVIQITSPTPGDGKSTLASNLAVSIAQSGKRVLLVDGDMRRPRQATTFGISSKTGFATVLSGESQWKDVVFECEEIEGLTVMPCGAKPNNPAELSSSPQVKELIEEMRHEFDFVIIDTPPMLAVTDACPIAARVDGVILCIRIKKNVRVSAERATEMLTNLGANCIGLVVNGVGAQSGYGSQYTYGAYRAGYSYNGYGYGYGYGYGAGKYYDDDRNTPPANSGVPKHIEALPSESHPPVA